MPHQLLTQIPNDLLSRTGVAHIDERRIRQLLKWLATHNVRATLLDIENERARRSNTNRGKELTP
jgi:hypothetical protein